MNLTSKPKARVLDMTTGKPLGLILRFAVPLFIGNIFQQVYSMVDTMVVGYHLGDSAIAAIGATAALYTLMINFANGLNIGYGIVVTQCFGAQDRKKMKQAIAGMMVLDGAASLILTTAMLLLLKPLMAFMNTPEGIFQQSYTYISVIVAGMAATLSYNMFAAILRAMGNSRSPLYFLIASSLLNVGLDLLFVAALGWGIAGAAAATVLAQTISAVTCGIYTFRNYREYLPEKEDFRVSGETLKILWSTGIAVAMMSCLVEIGSVIFQRENNLLGENIIAAFTAARKLLVIMIQPQATIAVATSTFIGQNWGAGKTGRIRLGLKRAVLLELAWGFTAAAIIFLFGGSLVRLTTGTSDSDVIANAVLSLRINFAMFPILGVLFCIRNALQAMGKKLVPVLSSCIELAMKLLAALVLIPKLGFLGTCITEPITWGLMTGFLMWFYLTRVKLPEE